MNFDFPDQKSVSCVSAPLDHREVKLSKDIAFLFIPHVHF